MYYAWIIQSVAQEILQLLTRQQAGLLRLLARMEMTSLTLAIDDARQLVIGHLANWVTEWVI